MTNYVYEVQGYYECGWEMLTTEETESDAKQMLACYDGEEPNVRHRIKRVLDGGKGIVYGIR